MTHDRNVVGPGANPHHIGTQKNSHKQNDGTYPAQEIRHKQNDTKGNTMNITISVTITKDHIQNLLCTAFDGSAYWASIVEYDYGEHSESDFCEEGKFNSKENYRHPFELLPLQDSCAVLISDAESGEIYRLDQDAVSIGVRLMADKYPEHLWDLLNENDDANTGDCFLQCALLGDELYS